MSSTASKTMVEQKAIRASIGQEHSSECPKCETAGEDCGEHLPTWEELAGYWKSEVERLREALRKIEGVRVDKHADNIWTGANKCAAIARAALKGE